MSEKSVIDLKNKFLHYSCAVQTIRLFKFEFKFKLYSTLLHWNEIQ